MPQNKPMKIQWITVNGRQVPLVLPQTYSYEIEDWKVTSDRDPLPIVEYGTTEGGVIVPKRVSDEGHELTQLTGSSVGALKETISGSRFGEIAAGTAEIVINLQEPCELESLSMGTDFEMMILRIENRKASGTYETGMRLILEDGKATNPILPGALNRLGGENDFWREFKHDVTNNRYAIGMKRSAKFSSGVRIRVENTDSVSHNVAVTYVITIFHS